MTNTKSTKSSAQSTIPTFREVTISGETYRVISDIICVADIRSPRRPRVVVDVKPIA